MIAIFMVIEKILFLSIFSTNWKLYTNIRNIIKKNSSFLAKTFRNLNWNTWKCFDEVDNINNQTKL